MIPKYEEVSAIQEKLVRNESNEKFRDISDYRSDIDEKTVIL